MRCLRLGPSISYTETSGICYRVREQDGPIAEEEMNLVFLLFASLSFFLFDLSLCTSIFHLRGVFDGNGISAFSSSSFSIYSGDFEDSVLIDLYY